LPLLDYFLDAVKALKEIQYSNAIAQLLTPLPGIEASSDEIPYTSNHELECQARNALQAIAIDELPAIITSS
jgi:hypothetical protein